MNENKTLVNESLNPKIEYLKAVSEMVKAKEAEFKKQETKKTNGSENGN